ncbi:transposase (plasmid) [Streptomyces sp. NBC_01591]|uniref:zinc ribbon domain-containing protein n=1 Tax=Streptomyces sp. NBC_01591 TaxID=2975888 RepID=UPI002DD7F785|nr:zinc ribbon domain-containing protein [Streptomyces sp. NBC_01591]WSD74648.1 transposase [Streptomyces sp. NBC_01591]
MDRWWPSSKTCSACSWQNPRLTLVDRTFHCDACGLRIDRDTNAAHNIAAHAVLSGTQPAGTVAPGSGETQNARGASVRLPGPRAGKQDAKKRGRRQAHQPGATSVEQSTDVPQPTPRTGKAVLNDQATALGTRGSQAQASWTDIPDARASRGAAGQDEAAESGADDRDRSVHEAPCVSHSCRVGLGRIAGRKAACRAVPSGRKRLRRR